MPRFSRPIIAIGQGDMRHLRENLRRMGMNYDYDPFLPPLSTAPEPRPYTVDTPGEPYPPGYYSQVAMASVRFDAWIRQLGTKDKVIPREKIFVDKKNF